MADQDINAGYTEGYNMGHREGYNKGYNRGYKNGDLNGRVKGLLFMIVLSGVIYSTTSILTSKFINCERNKNSRPLETKVEAPLNP